MKPAFNSFAKFTLAAGLLLSAVWTAAAEAPPVTGALRNYGVTSLLQETNKPWDTPIKLEGFVTAVCPRSGKKAWLHDTDSAAKGTIRIERGGNIPIFEKEVVGKTIRVTGILRELRIDAAYLDSWESRVKGSNTVIEKKDTCTEKCEENQTVATALQRIAALRKQVAESKQGYLSSFWVDGTNWELVEVKAAK